MKYGLVTRTQNRSGSRFGTVDTHRVTRTQPVILLNANTLKLTPLSSTVAHTEVKATGITLFHFVHDINLVRLLLAHAGYQWQPSQNSPVGFERSLPWSTEVTATMPLPSGAFRDAGRNLWRCRYLPEADLTHVRNGCPHQR